MIRKVFAAVLVLAASAVALDGTDIPGDIHSGSRVVRQADRDQGKPQTQSAPPPVSASLEQMSPAERENARISVEFASSDAELIALGHEVERLWNGGEFDEALAQLRSLEARVGAGHIAIGNSWRKPLPTLETTLWDSDVRIGNRDSLLELAFDTHLASGNLFVALRHGSQASEGMSVCMSSDGGATWSETFNWGSADTLASLDAAVVASHLYIAYAYPGYPRDVRLRRLVCADGSSDTFSNGAAWVTACTLAAGDTAREVALVGNQHSQNNRLYLTTIVSDGSVAYCWDTQDAVSWTRVATGITSGALNGLDATENESSDSTFLFFSYYDTSETLRVYGRTEDRWTRRYSRHTGDGEVTSISAYRDTIICAFDDETTAPYQVGYVINYGDVATWRWALLSAEDTTAEAPGITARGGGGLAAVFRHYTSTRQLRFRQRGYPNAAWSDPVSIADNEPYWNRPGIEYLGSSVYAVVYLSQSNPAIRGAYFDRSDWPVAVAEHRRLVMDENILNVTPNPLSGRGRLNYTLNRPAALRVQVFDRAGRVVRTLFDGHSPEGRQSFSFNATDMSPGVYFVRADADGRALTVPVTVVK